MKVDGFIPNELALVGDAAVDGRRAGLDAVWVSEVNHNPFVSAAVALDHDREVMVGTSIAVAFARTPMVTAAAAWDLQTFSDGRFILGLGSQVRAHIERRFNMPWSHPAARMREYLAALRAIWDTWQTGAPLDFRGDFYQHTLMAPAFDPGPSPSGPPKVFLAGVGQRMIEVAGTCADGLILHGFCTRKYLEDRVVPAVAAGLEASGRSRSDFEIAYPLNVVTGRTDAELAATKERARASIAFYASTPSYRPVLEVHGWETLQSELGPMSREGRWDEMASLVDDTILDAFAVVAPYDQVGSAIRERLAPDVDRVTVRPSDWMTTADFEDYVRRVQLNVSPSSP
jgi:probable F420-dependent oxidoreductase